MSELSLKSKIMDLVPKDKNRDYSQAEIKGLFLDVWEILKFVLGEVKYVRIPLDLRCDDCQKELPWGTWAHYQPDLKKAICTECGTKRGWTDKERATNLVKKRELQEDIKALRKRQKIEATTLYLLQQEVDLSKFGKRYEALEQEIRAAMKTVDSYLSKVATPEEKQALQAVTQLIDELRLTQKVIQEEVESRLFLLERSKRRKQHVPKVIDDEADAPLPEEGAAE